MENSVGRKNQQGRTDGSWATVFGPCVSDRFWAVVMYTRGTIIMKNVGVPVLLAASGTLWLFGINIVLRTIPSLFQRR